jgi:hypothetical protein
MQVKLKWYPTILHTLLILQKYISFQKISDGVFFVLVHLITNTIDPLAQILSTMSVGNLQWLIAQVSSQGVLQKAHLLYHKRILISRGWVWNARWILWCIHIHYTNNNKSINHLQTYFRKKLRICTLVSPPMLCRYM